MKIIIQPELISILDNSHLLLDTSVFIDAFKAPVEFGNFFNQLKENRTTLVTIDPVKLEFLKGTNSEMKFKEKKEYIENIIDATLPSGQDVFDLMFELVLRHREEGVSVSITDLLLGANLMKYKKSLFLLTKNTKDFPMNIFTFNGYILLLKRRTVQILGLYSFQ